MSAPDVLEAARGDQGEAYATFLVEHTTMAISPLPALLKRGLIAITFCGLLSSLTTFSLLVYLSYMLVRWYLRPPPPRPAPPTANRGWCRGGLVETGRAPDVYLCPKMTDEEDEAAGPDFKALSLKERLRWDPPNQFLILIYNLVLADLQQAIGFTVSLAWVVSDQAKASGQMCWMQGWFISAGDLGSSLFISAIAVHTYLAVIRNYKLPSWAFFLLIGILWGFNYLVTILGIVIDRDRAAQGGLYTRVMAWCWINTAYNDLRLGLHYIWIYISMALTTVIYIYIFAHLHMQRKIFKCARFQPISSTPERCSLGCQPSTQPLQHTGILSSAADRNGGGGTNADDNHPPTPAALPQAHRQGKGKSSDQGPDPDRQQHDQHQHQHQHRRPPPLSQAAAHPQGWRHQTFLMYPIIYMLCTAPLAMARARGIGNSDVPLGYFIFAGVMITSTGFLDVLLYSWTRRSIVFSAGARPPSQDLGLATFGFMRTPPGRKLGNVVYVSGGAGPAMSTAAAGGVGGLRTTAFNAADYAGCGGGDGGGGWAGGPSDSRRAQRQQHQRQHQQRWRRERERGEYPPPRDDRQRLPGMTIQCETVTSVSVEIDPDVLEISGLSLASRAPADMKAGASNFHP